MNSNYNFFKIRFLSIFKNPKSTPNSLFKALSLLVLVSLFSTNNSYGQCLQPTQFGMVTLSAEVSGTVIILCDYAGEYGTWNGAVAGSIYTFSSTIATDFLTISAVPGGPALAWGAQPLVYTSTVTGTLYVHVSTSLACGTANACRDVTGTTTALPVIGCTNGIAFNTQTLSAVVNGFQTIPCTYGGEYGTWEGAITGYAYNFSSTVATDFLTIHLGAPNGPIVASGTQPLSWLSNTTGTIYVHVNTDSACGAQNSCRDIKGTTTSLPAISVLTPSSGSNAIPCGQTSTLCTHAGCGNIYDNNVDGHTIINAANTAVVNINGTYNTEEDFDFITIYIGSGTGGAIAFGPVSGLGTINFTGTPGQTYTIRFSSDFSAKTTGYNLAVTYTGDCIPQTILVPYNGNNSIPCGLNSTLCSHAGCGQLYDNNANGYTVLNTIGATTVNVNGSYSTESSYDFITIYEGTGTGGTVLFGPVSGSGTINYTSLPGQTLTLVFSSDTSITDIGFSFAITYAGSCSFTAIPLCVTSPTAPANGSTICPAVTLSWPFVAQAESYDVYLNTGAGPATTLVSSAQTDTSYGTGLLAGSTSYSWRVVPKNGLGDAVGCSDFTFTTIAVPAEPTGLACYQTALFNATTCDWDVTGTQPTSPATPNINVTITDSCINLSGEWVNSGLLNGHYDFQYVFDEVSTFHISYDGVQWVLWVNTITETGFFSTSPYNGLYPPTTGWIPTQCIDGTLTWGYASQPLACYQTTLFNQTTCVWDVTGTQPTSPFTPSINVTIGGFCDVFSGEWVNSGLLNGHYDFQYVYQGDTLHISFDGVQWVLWALDITNTGFTNSSPSNGLYPPITGWTVTETGCGPGGTLTMVYPNIPPLPCNQSYVYNATTCVWDLTVNQPPSPPLIPNINVTITSDCIFLGGEWVNSGLLNGHYDFQYVNNGDTYHISYDGTQWVLWINDITNTGFFSTAPSNGLYPPTTEWIPTGCTEGTLTWEYASPLLACNQSYVFNTTTCVWDIVTGPPCESVVNLKLFIEGYYDGGVMRSVKNNQDGVSPLDEVENITVNLHRDSAPFEVLHTTTATLKTNGTAVATFVSAPSGSFYIAVTTSNAIETWTASPQIVGPTPLLYDFTTASTQAFEDNMQNVGGGVFAFFSGDINQDYVIDGSDATDLDLDIFNSEFGVRGTDLNGDGSVDGSDSTFFENNSFNSVFAHYPQ